MSSHSSFMENLKGFVRRRMELQQEEEKMKREELNLVEEEKEEESIEIGERGSNSGGHTQTQETNSAASSVDVNFSLDPDNHVIVFTDGACSRNGQQGAAAGYGVYFGEDNPLNCAGKVTGRVTNNNAEIQGAIHALRRAKAANIERLLIKTDSQFMIKCVEEWMTGWKKKGWKKSDGKPVQNREELMELDQEMRRMESVRWQYVPGHSNVLGNERADKMARDAAAR